MFMLERYSQPIFCSIEPGAALSAFLSAASTSACWSDRLFSRSRLNEPHTVWSAGIGLAAIHLALTNWLKSAHASAAWPSSLMSNTLGAAAVAALLDAGAALAASAGVAGVLAGSCLPHAVSASAALTASASGFRRVLVMRIASIGWFARRRCVGVRMAGVRRPAR